MLKISLALLFPTILLFILQLVQPLVQADGSRPVVLAMRFAAICLALTLLLGSLNLAQYSGWMPGFLDRNLLKTLHLQMGLLGWIGFLIFGVGFHVIPMFYLSKPFSDKQARVILVTAFGSLSALSTGSFLGMGKDWLILFSLPGLASVFYFSYILLRMLHQRNRKIHNSTLRLWQGGILALCLSLPLGLLHLVSPGQQWLFLFGIFFLSKGLQYR